MPYSLEERRKRNLAAVKRYQGNHREKVREYGRIWSFNNRRQTPTDRTAWIDDRYAAIASRLERLADSPDFIGPQYLAGFIDGEGCIGAVGIRRTIVGTITITNCEHGLLARLREQFGCGSLHLAKKGNKPNWRPPGRLQWHARNALVVLEWILPHLIVKRMQALLCIELIRMRDIPRWQRYIDGELRPDLAAREQEIRAQLATLNAKGPR
jgi:hypothetical protein